MASEINNPAPFSRRMRAPTITIDTSAVSDHDTITTTSVTPEEVSNNTSRPMSALNVSSPAQGSNFLSVPGARSRGNSTDSTANNDGRLHDLLNAKDALQPGSDTEGDFEVENNKFSFSPGQLGRMCNSKSFGAFYALRGLDGIAKGLQTDCKSGLSIDGIESRIVGPNEPAAPSRTTAVTAISYLPSPTHTLVSKYVASCRRRCSQTDGRRSVNNGPYCCTFGCGYRTKRAFDWRRHEETHEPQELWLCDQMPFFMKGNSPGAFPIRNHETASERDSNQRSAYGWNDYHETDPSINRYLHAHSEHWRDAAWWELHRTSPVVDENAEHYKRIHMCYHQQLPHITQKRVSVFSRHFNDKMSLSLVALTTVLHLYWPYFARAGRIYYESPRPLIFLYILHAILVANLIATAVIWKTGKPASFPRSYVLSFSSSRTISILSRLLPFAFFGPAYAQVTPNAESDWRQRALGALTDPLVTFASLLFPLVVFAITGYFVHHYHKNGREDEAAIGMLVMAVIFISLPKSSSPTTTEGDLYLRLVIGLAYALFVLVYCRLTAVRNRWGKGYCSIAAVLAGLMALIAMASPPVQAYWVALTKADPIFALSLTLPLAFALCDLVAYVSIGMNRHANAGSGLPQPVPGPRA